MKKISKKIIFEEESGVSVRIFLAAFNEIFGKLKGMKVTRSVVARLKFNSILLAHHHDQTYFD